MWPTFQHDPTGLALLQGCKDHPHEADRRLILADWLEDQGEPEVAGCMRQSLAAPETWIGFPDTVADRWWPLNGCWRAWISITCDPQQFPDTPWCSVWRRRRPLLDDNATAALAEAIGLAHLTTIDLYGSYIFAAGVKALLSSPHLSHLDYLDLRTNECEDEGVRELAASPKLVLLTTLRLSGNSISDEGALTLSQSPNLGRLTRLELDSNRITQRGFRALVESPHLSRLRALSLASNHIDAQAGRRLARQLAASGGVAVSF